MDIILSITNVMSVSSGEQLSRDVKLLKSYLVYIRWIYYYYWFDHFLKLDQMCIMACTFLHYCTY